MKTLKDKIFWLHSYIQFTDYINTHPNINLTFKNDGYTYHQIKTGIVDEYGVELLYFDDIIVGHSTPGTLRYGLKCTGKIHIIGGEDVENPDVIELFKIISENRYQNAPNDSIDSLDNKSIKFNPKLTVLPPKADLYRKQFYGVFKGRLVYNVYEDGYEEYIPFTANCIKFIDEPLYSNYGIKFINDNYGEDTNITYSFVSQEWSAAGQTCVPVFEEFKYTGLEDNEEFMKWLSENAEITTRKNKDKKLINLENCTIYKALFAYDFFETKVTIPSIDIRVYDGVIYNKKNANIFTFDKIWFDAYRIHFEGWCNVIDENQEGYPSTKGSYYADLIFDRGFAFVSYGNGMQAHINDELIMSISYFPAFNEDQDFIEGLVGNFDIQPESVERAIIKFPMCILPDIPLPAGERMLTSNISCETNDGTIKLHHTSTINILKVYPQNEGNYSFEILINGYASYGSIKCRRDGVLFYCDLDNEEHLLTSVTFRCWFMQELEFENNVDKNKEFIDWIYKNAEEVKFVKGTNTIEELLEELCDIIRYFLAYTKKINAQDIPYYVTYLATK